MTKGNLKKNVRVWCWWKSRYLYYTGIQKNNIFVFEDIAGEAIMINKESLKNLEVK